MPTYSHIEAHEASIRGCPHASALQSSLGEAARLLMLAQGAAPPAVQSCILLATSLDDTIRS